VKAEYTSNEQMKLLLKREGIPSDGDKMATLHGQKGVIKVIQRDEMPCACDPETGTLVEFDLVIAVSSVISRVTVGQIMELRAGRIAMQLHKTLIDSDYDWSKLQAMKPLPVYDRIKKKPLVTPAGREVFCEWGYGRAQLLHHLTAGKHHFTRIENTRGTKYTAKGRVGGGSIRLGDMESEAMVSSGLSICADELAMRRDMSIVNVCVRCNRQCIMCDCSDPNGDVRRMLIPFSTLSTDLVIFLTSGRSFEYYPNRQG